jgi:hypothetical protein
VLDPQPSVKNVASLTLSFSNSRTLAGRPKHLHRIMQAFLAYLAIQHFEKHSGFLRPAPPEILSQLTYTYQFFRDILVCSSFFHT